MSEKNRYFCNVSQQVLSEVVALPHFSLSIENSLSDTFKKIFERGNAEKKKKKN